MSFPYWPGVILGGGGTQDLSYNSVTQQISLTGSTPSTIQLQNVYQIVAGNNITLNPPTGQGVVTVNGAATGIPAPDAVISTIVVNPSGYIQAPILYNNALGTSSITCSTVSMPDVGGGLVGDFVSVNTVFGKVGLSLNAGTNEVSVVGSDLNADTIPVYASTIGRFNGGGVLGLYPSGQSLITVDQTVANQPKLGFQNSVYNDAFVRQNANGSLELNGYNAVKSLTPFYVSSLNISSINGAPYMPGAGSDAVFSTVTVPGDNGVSVGKVELGFVTGQRGGVIQFDKIESAGAYETVRLEGIPTGGGGACVSFVDQKNDYDFAAVGGVYFVDGTVGTSESGHILASGAGLEITGVSSINGAPYSAGGGAGSDPVVSTLTVADTGKVSLTYNNGGASLNFYNENTNADSYNFFVNPVPQDSQFSGTELILANVTGGNPVGFAPLAVGGVEVCSQALPGQVQGGMYSVNGGVSIVAPGAAGGNIYLQGYGVNISSLTVSSINGAAPGGGGSVPSILNISTLSFPAGNQTTAGVINMNTLLTVNDTTTAVGQDYFYQTNVAYPYGSAGGVSTNSFAVNCPSGIGATVEIASGNDNANYITSFAGGDYGVLTPLYIQATDVFISSMTVSSINGVAPGSGSIPANLIASTLTLAVSDTNIQGYSSGIGADGSANAFFNLNAPSTNVVSANYSLVDSADSLVALSQIRTDIGTATFGYTDGTSKSSLLSKVVCGSAGVSISSLTTDNLIVSSINGNAVYTPLLSTLGALPGNQYVFPNISTGVATQITEAFDLAAGHYYKVGVRYVNVVPGSAMTGQTVELLSSCLTLNVTGGVALTNYTVGLPAAIYGEPASAEWLVKSVAGGTCSIQALTNSANDFTIQLLNPTTNSGTVGGYYYDLGVAI